MRASWFDRGLSVLLMLSSAAMACFFASDGDLGFHLATGREVLATGRIPSSNVLSYAQANHEWLLHQWLPGVVFEWAFRAFGIAGVTALKMLLVALILRVTYASARVVGASPIASFVGCLFAATAGSFRFESRPYLFTHLTLAISVLCIAHFARAAAAADARGQRRALLGAVGTAAVACQLHAGAIDSFLVMLLAALGCAFEPLRARVFGTSALAPRGVRAAGAWVLTALAALGLAGLALAAYHPIGARILSVPFAMGTDSYLGQHLVEFRNPWRFPLVQLLGYWLFLAAALGAVAARARVTHAVWLALVLGYAVLSLRFARMAFAFAIVAAPFIALSLERAMERVSSEVRPRLRNAALVVLALGAPFYVYRDHHFGFGFESSIWPLAHFEFISQHGLRGPAFVSDAWAGTFLGRFYPERKAFFDNRLDAYSPEFMHLYQSIRYGESGWDRRLDQYGVEIILLRYTTPGEAAFQHGRPNLRHLLARDPRYTLVRFDDVGELFVRTRGQNAELAERFALRGVDPDRRTFVRPPAECAPALVRALARGERSATLLGLTAQAAAAAGEAQHAGLLLRQAQAYAPDDPWVAGLRTQLMPPRASAADLR